MIEVGKFYMAGVSIYQVLQADGSFAFVKNWNPAGKGETFVTDTTHLHLRCLNDYFVAFVTGQWEE